MTQNYLWPDLSPVIRQYIVKDDLGRYGLAFIDPVYHDNIIFAHPIDVPAEITSNNAVLMTDTAWQLHQDGSYRGTWYDYSGPTYPSTVPDDLIRHLTIVADLGYLLPDKFSDLLLPNLPANQPAKATMNVQQAEEYASEVGEPIKARAIRLAATRGDIPNAQKVGRDWIIPYTGFNYYLDHRPKPGRKTSPHAH